MINLTNNQVIALNRIFNDNTYKPFETQITIKISIGVISIIIRYPHGKRFYWIRKNRIESVLFRFKKQKKGKLYIYKLKKR